MKSKHILVQDGDFVRAGFQDAGSDAVDSWVFHPGAGADPWRKEHPYRLPDGECRRRAGVRPRAGDLGGILGHRGGAQGIVDAGSALSLIALRHSARARGR